MLMVYIYSEIENAVRGMGKEIMSRLCNIFKVEPAEFYIDRETPIPATELEKKALYTIREAEKLGVSYIAEESIEYTKHRLETIKKTGKTEP